MIFCSHIKHSRAAPTIVRAGAIDDIISAVREALEAAPTDLADEYRQPSIESPCMAIEGDGIGGPVVTDPLLIYVGLSAGDDTGDPTWSFSLSDWIDDLIADHEHGASGAFGEGDKVKAGAIRDGLRKLADRLDAAIKREDPPHD